MAGPTKGSLISLVMLTAAAQAIGRKSRSIQRLNLTPKNVATAMARPQTRRYKAGGSLSITSANKITARQLIDRDPSSATRPSRRLDRNSDAMAGFAAGQVRPLIF